MTLLEVEQGASTPSGVNTFGEGPEAGVRSWSGSSPLAVPVEGSWQAE